MTSCKQCGSIQIARARAEPLDKAIEFFTAKRPFVCRRCGWRGRRVWTDADLATLRDRLSSDTAEVDPALAVLDSSPLAKKSKRTKRKRPQDATDFGLAAIDLGSETSAEANIPSRFGDRRRVRRRRKRSRKREIIAAIALSSLAVFLIAMLGLTGSCGGATRDF